MRPWNASFLLAVSLLLFGPLPAWSQTTADLPAADVVTKLNLRYGGTKENPLELDLVHPAQGEGPFPTVVYIHAPGPLAKGRKHYWPRAQALAHLGYVGVVISYRHLADVPYPGAVDDAETAIRWLRTHAADYKIDPGRIAAIGYSGGGALACLLGMKSAALKRPETPSSRVQAVIAYYPPSDYVRLYEDCHNGSIPFSFALLISTGFEAWLGGPPKKIPERYQQASPISHVAADMAPLLLMHGMADKAIPARHSEIFAKHIGAKKGRVVFVSFAEALHNFDDDDGPSARIAVAMERSFLAEFLQSRSTVRKKD